MSFVVVSIIQRPHLRSLRSRISAAGASCCRSSYLSLSTARPLAGSRWRADVVTSHSQSALNNATDPVYVYTRANHAPCLPAAKLSSGCLGRSNATTP